jgi:hypothetical protein
MTQGVCKSAPNRMEFKIIIRAGLNYDNTIRIICHEYIHVSQVSSGRLIYGELYQTWEGVQYDLHLSGIKDVANPTDLPWEKEAYNLEEICFEAYKNEVKSSDLPYFFKKLLWQL